MAYDIPFDFNPNKKTIDATTDVGVDENPYIPVCEDSDLLIRENHREMNKNYAQNFGMTIKYWSTGFSTDNYNPIYGEDTTARYRGPRKLKAIIDFQAYSTFISKYGMMSDLDIQVYIPIKEFQRIWGDVYPLNGDLFQIEDSACDRPLLQEPMIFEITEKHDSINPADFAGGHYVWKITAKRYDDSHEPNAPDEFSKSPVNTDEYGVIDSENGETEIVDDDSTHDVDEDAKEDFDNPNDSIYGGYF